MWLQLPTHLGSSLPAFRKCWKGWQHVAEVGCEWGVAEALSPGMKSHSSLMWLTWLCRHWPPMKEGVLWYLWDGAVAPPGSAPTTLCLLLLDQLMQSKQCYTLGLWPVGSPVASMLLQYNSSHVWWLNEIVPRTHLSFTWRSCFYD